MKFCSHRSGPTIEKVIRKASSLTDSRTRQTVLQTDASDEYWATALFEEIDGKRNICGYKSGAFKPLELHYHSTFKEILAVKHGIENFQFHLLGHNFLIEMDISSFPKMLPFKRKNAPTSSVTQMVKLVFTMVLPSQAHQRKN